MNKLTAKQVAYLAHGEGLVLEAYRDTEGVWTWALGVTNASGHMVFPRYVDKPQTIAKCVEVSEWLMREKYLPSVLKAFEGVHLSEAQIAAALSFHWNTGAIRTTSWVSLYMAGRRSEARKFLETHYLNGGDLKSRRMEEAELFFDGTWPKSIGKVMIWNVDPKTKRPRGGKSMDIMPTIQQVLGGN